MITFTEVRDKISQMGLTVPLALVWGAALFGALMSASAADRYLKATKVNSGLNNAVFLSSILMVKTPLLAEDYNTISEKMQLEYKNSILQVRPDGLQVGVNDVKDYSKFLNIVRGVMDMSPDVRWDISQMCAGTACGSPAYSLVMRGQRINFKNKFTP